MSLETPPHRISNSIIRSWQNYERQLRNELARQRAQQLKREVAPYLRRNTQSEEQHPDDRLVQALRAAVLEPNPLLAEQMLNHIRWVFLNELSREQFFSVEVLQIYYLKLQLLERTAQFDRTQGEDQFQQAYAAAAKQLNDVAVIQL